MKLKDSLGCSDQELVAFETLTAERRAHSKLPILDFRKADLGFFKDLLGKTPENKSLEEREALESWLIFLSKLRSNVSKKRGSQAKSLGGLCGRTRSSWSNSNTKGLERMEARTSSLRGETQ